MKIEVRKNKGFGYECLIRRSDDTIAHRCNKPTKESAVGGAVLSLNDCDCCDRPGNLEVIDKTRTLAEKLMAEMVRIVEFDWDKTFTVDTIQEIIDAHEKENAE